MGYRLLKILTNDYIPTAFLKLGEKRKYKSDEILKNPHENFDGAYILLKGSAAVRRFSDDGQQIIRFILKPPCIMGEIYAITEDTSSSIFQFLKNSEVLFINREELINLIKNDDEVYTFIFKSIRRKMMIFANQFDENIFLKSEIQVAALFYEFTIEFGEEFQGYLKINFNLNQQLIADLLCINKSTVFRSINKLKDDDLISQAGHRYIIKDINLLEEYIQEHSLFIEKI